jgi:hypothetical protein
MNAMADGQESPQVSLPTTSASTLVKLNRCERCKLPYLQSKSTSALKLTYCSFLCELGDLGFSMVGLESMKRVDKEVEPTTEQPPQEVGV